MVRRLRRQNNPFKLEKVAVTLWASQNYFVLVALQCEHSFKLCAVAIWTPLFYEIETSTYIWTSPNQFGDCAWVNCVCMRLYTCTWMFLFDAIFDNEFNFDNVYNIHLDELGGNYEGSSLPFDYKTLKICTITDRIGWNTIMGTPYVPASSGTNSCSKCTQPYIVSKMDVHVDIFSHRTFKVELIYVVV